MKKPKKTKKFRLLLDAAFAQVCTFVKLSKKANLAHIVHSLNQSAQVSDKEIYNMALRENRFVVTIDARDFKKLVRESGPGIIVIPPYLSNQEIDKL